MKRLVALGAFVAFGACTATDSATPTGGVALSAEGARHIAPRYSPDGANVAFWQVAADAPVLELWVADAAFKTPVKLPVVTQVPIPAVWSRDGARLAVVSSQDGIADVAIVTVAGGAIQRITDGPGVEAPIAWHPDGDRIAYIESTASGLFTTGVISISSGKSVPLVPGEKRPAFGMWSPDGTKIVYNVNDGSSLTIWVADAEGGNARQLTSEGFENLANAGMPWMIWSPDSKEVAYESRRTGTSDIWVVSVADGKTRQLTRDLRNDISPTYSPDGKWIAFISDRGQQTDTWMVPAAGGAEVRITDDRTEEAAPSWRPDGKAIAFVTTTSKGSAWTYSLADSSEHRLTPDSLRVVFFNVSPDGKHVSLVYARGGGIHDLVVANIDGTGSRTIVAGGGSVNGAYWSPDGSKIQFVSDRGGTQDIWVIDAAGGAPRQLTNWPGFENQGIWNSDGSAVYFVSDHETRLGDVWSVPVGGGAPTRVTNNGTVGPISAVQGGKELFVGVISPNGGRLTYARLRPGGVLQPMWEESNALTLFDRRGGDSVIVAAEVGPVTQTFMVSLDGKKGRKVLKPDELPNAWTRDGKMLLYFTPGASQDIAILNVITGESRQLTKTADTEEGAEFTPDGKTVVFRRMATVQRVFSADVSKLLTAR